LLKQLYIGQPYVPRNIYVPVDFEDREVLEDLLSEQVAGEGARAHACQILVPQRGDKRGCSIWQATMPSSPTISASA
jgi:excinuclease ABC subunit C